jgi:hypothetical protein
MAADGHALRKAFPLAARFRGSIDAFAVDAELPAMENATQAVPFVARQAQARAAMRACFLQKADPSVGRAEGDEVLAEEADLLRGAIGFQLGRAARRHPVFPQHGAHRRARPDPGEQGVVGGIEHVRSPNRVAKVGRKGRLADFPKARTIIPVGKK